MTKSPKLTHKQEISDRRARAAAMIAQNEKKEKRNKIALWSTLGVVVIAVIAMVAFVVTTSNANKLAVSTVSPNALSTNGVILTSLTDVVKGTGYDLENGQPAKSAEVMKDSKVPHIEIYLDYDCPHCKEFEDANANYLNSLLSEGQATVEYKPIVVIGSNLSISGGNAAVCTAEYAPERFNDVHTALFAAQGKQNTTVTSIIKSVGIEGEAGEQVLSCLSSKVFGKWLDTANEHALALKDEKGETLVQGTPTVIVDGKKFTENPANLPAYLDQLINSDAPAQDEIQTVE